MDSGFWRLREMPLHTLDQAGFDAYCPAMAAWLDHDDAGLREGVVERLATAVFWFNPSETLARRGDAEAVRTVQGRVRWLLASLEAAQVRRPDVLTVFLEALRWKGDEPLFQKMLLDWLGTLRARPDVPGDRVEGTFILHGGYGDDAERGTPHWMALLDHPSDDVRGCAARMLGQRSDWDDPAAMRLDAPLLAAITAKEIARPGIAGAFWSGWEPDIAELSFDPVEWMLDIVERRAGPEPEDMPFNGIDFHLHELGAFTPPAVRRLIACGRLDLALMTATEVDGIVDGMREVLWDLGDDPDAEIAVFAHLHLAQAYDAMHPRADPARLRHFPNWRPGMAAYVMRQGDPAGIWRDAAVFFRRGSDATFDDATARDVLDAALPSDMRGPMERHPIASHDDPVAPTRLGDEELSAYASGALVNLRGDPDARRWRRLTIIGRGLQKRWRPFDWTAEDQSASS